MSTFVSILLAVFIVVILISIGFLLGFGYMLKQVFKIFDRSI